MSKVLPPITQTTRCGIRCRKRGLYPPPRCTGKTKMVVPTTFEGDILRMIGSGCPAVLLARTLLARQLVDKIPSCYCRCKMKLWPDRRAVREGRRRNGSVSWGAQGRSEEEKRVTVNGPPSGQEELVHMRCIPGDACRQAIWLW